MVAVEEVLVSRRVQKSSKQRKSACSDQPRSHDKPAAEFLDPEIDATHHLLLIQLFTRNSITADKSMKWDEASRVSLAGHLMRDAEA